MVQRELQTLEVAEVLVLEEQVVAEHIVQVMVVQVSWLREFQVVQEFYYKPVLDVQVQFL
jgi:hypothetical protein